ncbi:23S rRNA pseudouridine955/2504/2580 synthase [Chitinivorax tropicus]|uniref:Pseudouridine synthase n=1 Tax=Chitinivorax tropicus TaxID=714531 RepID=A0A840MQW9_9PROT|nr:RluA family pseudouridine synthase [Chitinivorax tropicus]MBB5019825.1 23S rRNA pseudouridine955/2504/2580 synthase [Chitinivorax tropicus]
MSDIRKDSVTMVTVAEDGDGQRLDNYLMRLLKGVPKSHIYRIIRSGEVRVNKGRAQQTDRLRQGDVLRIPPIRLSQPAGGGAQPTSVPKVEFDILFEDDAMLVINKPAGMAVHGGSGISRGVIEQLRLQHPEYKFLELVHRLDRETSGVLLLAKKRSALVALHEAMRDNETDKRYLTMVKGRWVNQRQSVKLPLLKYLTADGERRVSVNADGQASHTVFNRLKGWDQCTLLEAELKTGRTHQIRVHLSHLGFPILGDDKYGDFPLNKLLAKDQLKRMFLHAYRLTLRHPLSGAPMVLQADLPPDLQAFVDNQGQPLK